MMNENLQQYELRNETHRESRYWIYNVQFIIETCLIYLKNKIENWKNNEEK